MAQSPVSPHDNSNNEAIASSLTAQDTNSVLFTKPLSGGRVTDRYGMRRDPFLDSLRHHDGIDISAPRGTEVYAAAAGVVKEAKLEYEKNNGYGRFVVLDHGNGWKTLYSQLDTLFVKSDQWVKGGEIIALVGSTGRATGPHLHFELHKQDKPDNPELYVPEMKK
jgi:murein DD-endopeptidase MepM/ murein hydrolase activator NlpD